MGGTTSTTNQSVDIQAALNLNQDEYQSLSQSCQQEGSASNIVEIIGSKGVNLTANQKNELTNMCVLHGLLTSNRDASANVNTFTQLAAAAQAKGGFPSADSDANQSVRQQMSATVNQNTYNNALQSCTAASNTDNIIRVVGSTDVNANVNQVNKAFNQCLLDYASDHGITATGSTTAGVEATAKSEATGYDIMSWISNIFGSMYTFSGVVAVVILCSLVVICLPFIMGGSSSSPSPTVVYEHPHSMQGGFFDARNLNDNYISWT